MAIPDYQAIMLPLLQHTADGEIHTARGLKEALADYFGLTPDERQHMLPSGQQTTFHNRLAWVCSLPQAHFHVMHTVMSLPLTRESC